MTISATYSARRRLQSRLGCRPSPGVRPRPEAAHRRQRRSSHRRNRLQVPHRTEMNPRQPDPGRNAENYVRTGDSARTDCGQYTTYTARIFGARIAHSRDRQSRSVTIAGHVHRARSAVRRVSHSSLGDRGRDAELGFLRGTQLAGRSDRASYGGRCYTSSSSVMPLGTRDILGNSRRRCARPEARLRA